MDNLPSSIQLKIYSYLFQPYKLRKQIRKYKKIIAYNYQIHNINKIIKNKLHNIDISYINEFYIKLPNDNNKILLSFIININNNSYIFRTYLTYNKKLLERLYQDKYIFLLFCIQSSPCSKIIYEYIIEETLDIDIEDFNIFVSKLRTFKRQKLIA